MRHPLVKTIINRFSSAESARSTVRICPQLFFCALAGYSPHAVLSELNRVSYYRTHSLLVSRVGFSLPINIRWTKVHPNEGVEHTCDVCADIDGQEFDYYDEVPERPHPNCKCYVEIVEYEDENSSPEPSEDEEP